MEESKNTKGGTMFLENIGHWIKESHIKGMELGMTEGMERGMAEGIERGMVEGKRKFLLQFAQSKWGELPPQLVEKIRAIQDACLLDTLSKNFVHMTSLAEFTHAVQTTHSAKSRM